MFPKSSPAVRRYIRRVAICMTVYTGLIFAMGTLFRENPPQGAMAWVLATLPALPIIGVIWAIMRLLVEETDEYMRWLFNRQVLIATGFCLVVMTVWEFLQNYDVVPDGTGGFGATFVWFIGLGIGALVNWRAVAADRS